MPLGLGARLEDLLGYLGLWAGGRVEGPQGRMDLIGPDLMQSHFVAIRGLARDRQSDSAVRITFQSDLLLMFALFPKCHLTLFSFLLPFSLPSSLLVLPFFPIL